MRLTDGLLYDHEVLRGKLALIEDYLPALASVPVTLARLTDSLACCLRAHTEREEQILDALRACRGGAEEETIEHVHDEHQNQRMRLAILHELLTRPGGASDAQAVAQAEYLIRDLRSHMARVETLFPTLEACTGRVSCDAPASAEVDASVECLGMA